MELLDRVDKAVSLPIHTFAKPLGLLEVPISLAAQAFNQVSIRYTYIAAIIAVQFHLWSVLKLILLMIVGIMITLPLKKAFARDRP
jgi:hypothetical protein